jgi:hypothetical protein
MSSLGNVISNAKNSIVGGVQNGLQQIATGDIEGGVDTLVNTPADALANLSGGPGLGDAMRGMQARSDAIQNWCWYCILPAVNNSNSLNLGGLIPQLGNLQAQVSLPWYYVQTASLPQRNIQTDSVNINGHPVNYPESYSVEALNLGLFMDSSSKVHQYLKAWQGQILGNVNPSVARNQGMWGLPAKYKKTINIVLLNVTKKQMLNVKYLNCWPTNISALELNSSSAEAMIQNVSFEVEDVDVRVYNDKGLIDNLLDTATGYAMGALNGLAAPYLNNLGSSILKSL